MPDRLVLPAGIDFPHTLLDISIEFDTHIKTGKLASYQPIPTGFQPLDSYLGGGLVPASLVLVGGPPGVGKTIFVLQAARNIAAAQDKNCAACVVCFEHDEVYLYHRLLCMESVITGSDGITMDDIRRAALKNNTTDPSLETLLGSLNAARSAWSRIVQYWERLFLIKGHPIKTTLNVLETYLMHIRSQFVSVVLFVDYLQKVPVMTQGLELTPERQIRTVTEGLKNLALSQGVPVVAVAASDSEGLKAGRVRFEDLWGGSSVNYEPDVALLLNRVSRAESEDNCNEVSFTIAKNRLGPTNAESRHRLNGKYFVFDGSERSESSLPTNPATAMTRS